MYARVFVLQDLAALYSQTPICVRQSMNMKNRACPNLDMPGSSMGEKKNK